MERTTETIEYSRVVDNTVAYAGAAVFDEQACMVTIVKHRAKVIVEYLAEFPNGERRWVRSTRDSVG